MISDKHLIWILLVAVILCLYKISDMCDKLNMREGFGSTSPISTEALADLASVYNKGKLTVNELEVTGSGTIGKDLSVKNDFSVGNESKAKYFRLSGAQIPHTQLRNVDGCFYRSGGQVFMGHDDNIYFRNTKNGKQIRFATDGGTGIEEIHVGGWKIRGEPGGWLVFRNYAAQSRGDKRIAFNENSYKNI